MAETGTVTIKNGKIEFVKFGKGEKPFVILPGLSYDGFFDKADEIALTDIESGVSGRRKTTVILMNDLNTVIHCSIIVADLRTAVW